MQATKEFCDAVSVRANVVRGGEAALGTGTLLKNREVRSEKKTKNIPVLKWMIMRRFERCVPGSSPGGDMAFGMTKDEVGNDE